MKYFIKYFIKLILYKMLFKRKSFFSFLILVFLLSFSLTKRPSQISNKAERIKKSLFLDSYMLSQNELFNRKNLSKEFEKEKEASRKLEENYITLKDVGFFPYDVGSPYYLWMGYRSIYANIGKDRSKYILYPYGFKYFNNSDPEEKEQSKGGFFSLNSSLIPSPEVYQKLANISSVKISKSKALYDIDIGIFTYETKLNGNPTNLFSEANQICGYFSQALPKVSQCAQELKDLKELRAKKPNKGNILMITPTILKDNEFVFKNGENNFNLLIIPDHVIDTEDLILEAWGAKGIQKIKDFVSNGGNILATGKSGYILEKLGLISEGTYKTDKFLYYMDSTKEKDNALISLTGCEDIVTKTPSEQPDFIKQTMCMTRYNKIYLTSAYTMDQAIVETKKELSVIMSLNSDDINSNLKYKLVDGNDAEIGNDKYFPLVLSKQEDKKGALFIINGNLFPDTDITFQFLLNPIFYAMGKNIIFDAYVKYSDGMEENAPIPGGEEGVRLNCFFKFLNLIELPVKDITVDVFIAKKTEFISAPEGCIKVTNDKSKYINLTDMDMDHYMRCNLAQLQKYSEFSKEIVIEITDQSVTQKATAIPLFYPFLEYTDSETNEKINIDYGPVTVTASLSAILRVTANSDPPGDYPLWGHGLFLDQIFNVENKENTAANNVNLISVIPVISPLVQDIEGNSVVHTNELYDAYYKKHEYVYPFTKTAEHVDFIDYAELSGKDVVIVKDLDQPVKYVKVDRSDVKEKNEVKDLFEVTGNLNTNINEETTLKTNNQMLLKEICYKDADIFYEIADFRRFVFIDTSNPDGAKTYYNNDILEDEKDPADNTRAKINIPFSRVDFYFETDPNYQIPTNITNDMIFTTDKYEEPTIKTDKEIGFYKANISKAGNFDNSKHDGKLIPDEFYNVLKQHNQIKKYIDPLDPEYNITKDFPDITLSHYLIVIKGNRITRAGSIKGFVEEEGSGSFKQGYLKEYPTVKFIYAHTVNFVIGKNLTRLGGKLVINLGTNEFKNNKLPSENEFVTLSVDGVAVYKIEYDYVKGEKNIIYAYFKRGLMPDEISGKDSSVELNIENLTSTGDISATIELYELKYDLSKKENHFEDYLKIESFISEQTLKYQKFWSLPCLIINNRFERNESTTIKEYELIDPYARYRLYYQELMAHRTVFANSLSNHPTNPGLQTPYGNYGLISNIGIVSIPFSDYVTHPALIIPAATSTSRIEWDDVWGRRWAQPIRSIFPDFLPLPYVSQSFMMSTTYEIIQDGKRVLEWGSADPGYVMIHIKFLNNYFKYVNLAICKDNSEIIVTETDNITISHSNVYGKCYQSTDSFLSGRKIDNSIISQMTDAMLCPESDNAEQMIECTERIKSLELPLLQMRDSKADLPEGYKWNYSPLVESYYPKGYLDEEIMWDMTKANYASDVYYKGYPWHYDNNLPGFDRIYEKADNLLAFPIFKGFGYKMDYSPNNTILNRYNNGKGWWSDNLQNKDNTLLAGQPYVNINPTINKTILTDDYWVNGKNMVSEKLRKKLKNIYICQFNQHRIKVDPSTTTQKVTYQNIYQNNIIPIYPEINDDDYRNYDCTNQYQYSPQNISLVDNRVRTNNDRDWLYFAVNLRAEAKETLNILLTLDPFSDRKYEGETKINDGGRFTYWNPALTKNGYIYLDNNVNVVNAFRVDLIGEVTAFPNEVNTFKAVNYHLFSLEDPNEKLREYRSTTYTNSYGYGDSTVMINVGGPQNTDCRLRPGESTFIKITFFNNAGFDWNLKAGAITTDVPNINIKPNTLMKNNNVHSIRVPKEYNFLELVIPEPLKNYVEIIPSDHNKDVLPQFFDFECINLVTIRDGFKGEYYYKLTLKEGLDKKYFGRFWEIKVNLKYEYFDILPGSANDPATKVNYEINMKHDYQLKVPPIKFGIRYPSNHAIPEYRNKVFYTIGRATNISISYNIHEEFTLDDIKIVSEEEVEKIRKATGNSANVNEQLLDIWNNGIANKSSYLTGEIKADPLEPANNYKRIWIYLNESFPELPYEIYGEPDCTKIYILVKVSAPQVTYGTRQVLKWGYAEYNDSRVIKKSNTGLAYSISSSGPWINVDIEYTIVKYDKVNDNFTEEENQKNYPLKGYMKLKITALNGGNKDAYQTSYKYLFSKYANILKNYGDIINKKDIISLSNNGDSGETVLNIDSNRQIPQNTKDAYNVYIFYDFEEIGVMNSILVQRNLAEENDMVIVKSADVTLCQNVKCNDDDSFVNQFININFKMSTNNIVEQDDFELVPELERHEEEKSESKFKTWIIGVIVACVVVVACCVYLFIDYKKKIWIFKKKEDTNIATVEKPESAEIQKIEDNVEKISVQKKRRIQNSSNYFSVDNNINSKN